MEVEMCVMMSYSQALLNEGQKQHSDRRQTLNQMRQVIAHPNVFQLAFYKE